MTTRILTAIGTAALLALPALGQELRATFVSDAFSDVVHVCSPPADPENRLFIVERAGRIRILEAGSVLPTAFLDVSSLTSTEVERGLLGLAFHPDYATNGRFFVSYTTREPNASVVREYRVSSDPDLADPSGTIIFGPYPQPFENHNGGCIQFGGDGKLYLGLGDGGAAHDPLNLGQDRQTLIGKMLRFDVDIPFPHIPPDNPFVGDPTTLDEVWAVGVRNPWRFSFDRATGDLWIGDVGQAPPSGREEINYAPATSTGGENYGWRCKHGSSCSGMSGCSCSDTNLVDPIHQYATASIGRAVIGGFVYRGLRSPQLHGTYFYGDYRSSRIWSLRYDGQSISEYTDRTLELEPEGKRSIDRISAFGEDAEGELYVVDHFDDEIYRMEQAWPEPFNYCSATTNSTGNPALISSTGSVSLHANDTQLLASQVPPNNTGLFLCSLDRHQLAVGNGNLCIGWTTLNYFIRLPGVVSSPLGVARYSLDLSDPRLPQDQLVPGSNWNFTYWYRDAAAGGVQSNFSDGLGIVFRP